MHVWDNAGGRRMRARCRLGVPYVRAHPNFVKSSGRSLLLVIVNVLEVPEYGIIVTLGCLWHFLPRLCRTYCGYVICDLGGVTEVYVARNCPSRCRQRTCKLAALASAGGTIDVSYDVIECPDLEAYMLPGIINAFTLETLLNIHKVWSSAVASVILAQHALWHQIPGCYSRSFRVFTGLSW